jgi:predicted dehydrogenase
LPKPTLNIAMLGSKFMGKAHSNAWSKAAKFFDLPATPVMHTASARNPDDLETFAAQWGWEQWTTKWKDAVTDEAIDLVDIGTPNRLHAPQAIAALEAGKHVACEKPLAGTLADARAMRDAAKKARGKTFVWYSYRGVPAVALAQQLVSEGFVGRIYHVRAAYLQGWGGPDTPLLWRFRGREAGTGAHGDLNAHIIDMARFITGDDIVEIAGAIEKRFITERPLPDDPKKTGRSTVDDAVLFLARFRGGAVASFEATRLATGVKNSNRIEIHGEKGAIRFNFERMNELEIYDADQDDRTAGWKTIYAMHESHPWASNWWPDGHGLGYEHTFVNLAGDIVRSIAGKQPTVAVPDFADAYETQRVMEAALVSARNHSAVRLSEVR